MSHTKYHTDALILSGVDTGEADRFVQMLTRDLGLVGVHVRGVRKSSSKQRPYLQPLSTARVSLVKGRNIWRLTNVQDAHKGFGLDRRSSHARIATARISRILRRFIKGEEPGPDIFEAVFNGLIFMETDQFATEASLVENLIVLRIFFHLGYIAPSNDTTLDLASSSDYSSERVETVRSMFEEITSMIYNAVEKSGL